jgi:hypothetical protein
VTKPALIPIEGLEKTTRGEGEWESIKILMQELAYIPSSNPKPKSYKKVINTPTNIIEMISAKL